MLPLKNWGSTGIAGSTRSVPAKPITVEQMSSAKVRVARSECADSLKIFDVADKLFVVAQFAIHRASALVAVSYTHLTLPTKRIV